MNDEEIRICDSALRTWGPESQIIKCIEEMAELTKKLSKGLTSNGKVLTTDIIEEIVDVEITLLQLKLIYGQADIYNAIKSYKFSRLKRLIEKAKENTIQAK